MVGLPPEAPHWPDMEQLGRLLRCRPGHPVSTKDIEADCVTLLGTGKDREAHWVMLLLLK